MDWFKNKYVNYVIFIIYHHTETLNIRLNFFYSIFLYTKYYVTSMYFINVLLLSITRVLKQNDIH